MSIQPTHHHRFIRPRLAIGALAFVTVGILPTASASADHGGPPVTANCVGTTFKTAAAILPAGDVGALIAAFAQAPGTAHPGLGDGIQDLQAGLVPDDVAPNTCND